MASSSWVSMTSSDRAKIQVRVLTGLGQKSGSGVDRIMMTLASGLTGSKNESGSYWVGFSDWVKLTSA